MHPDLPPGVRAALLDVTAVISAPTGMSELGVRTSIGTPEGSACVIDARGAYFCGMCSTGAVSSLRTPFLGKS